MTQLKTKPLVKTPLRYPGGKSRAIKFLRDYIPFDFLEYREPFFGGGSIGLFVAQTHNIDMSIKKNIFFVNDLNYNLYCFWEILKTDCKKLIDAIKNTKNNYKDGRTLYCDIINRRNSTRENVVFDNFQRAIDFFILNRITFSGLLDCGGFSQKAYQYRFTLSSIDRLYNVANIIKNFKFSCDSYENMIQKNGDNVFIFLDPPYFSATKSKLYGKNGDLHINFNHHHLNRLLRQTKHRFLLTYDDSEFIRELYKDFHVKEWSLQYGMNNVKQDRAQKGRELLISNF